MIMPLQKAQPVPSINKVPRNRLAARMLRLHSDMPADANSGTDERIRDLQDQLEKLMSNSGAVARPKPVAAPLVAKRAAKRKRVQIRLSPKLVRILQKFSSTGQSAGHLIEKTMWRDEQIRDAALILGISPPPINGRRD